MADDPAAAVLAGLDFAVTCGMWHMGKPCERPAAYFAAIHDCTSETGWTRVPICKYFLIAAEALHYPVACPNCPHVMHDSGDYVKDIQPAHHPGK